MALSFYEAKQQLLSGLPLSWAKFGDHKAGSVHLASAGARRLLHFLLTCEQFKVADGLVMEAVASEPVVRQPLNLHFDERGRLWVVQYLQYPFPAGLKIVKYDQYLRAVYDRVPPPPPDP